MNHLLKWSISTAHDPYEYFYARISHNCAIFEKEPVDSNNLHQNFFLGHWYWKLISAETVLVNEIFRAIKERYRLISTLFGFSA